MDKEGFKIPESIRKMIESGHTSFYKTQNGKVFFYDFATKGYKELVVSEKIVSLNALRSAGKIAKQCGSASLIDLGNDVFCLEFNTKMNTLNLEIVEFFYDALDHVDANGAGLVIGNQAGGMPGVFSAGADLKEMTGAIKEKQYSVIEGLIDQLHDVLQKARYSDFPVVAAPYGITLGGGCEICLSVDRIVAHAELYMGLVEIGVGLIPAGGGCLNLWKKFMGMLPEVVTDVDLSKLFIPVFMNIAMAKVSSSAADARANGFLGPEDRIVFNRNHQIGEAKKEVLNMSEAGYSPPVKRKIKVLGQAAQGMINVEIFNMAQGRFVTEYDTFLAKRIASVISGGDVRENSEIDEAVILQLEKEAFIDFLKEEKTVARIEHMLKTGKPLRN
jgi:3-hydroxyacyl-CoA dehydrogenase